MPQTPQTPLPPPFTEAQVKYLESCYPDRAPDEGASNRRIWIAVGQAKVARHIRGLYEKQLQKTLEGAPMR